MLLQYASGFGCRINLCFQQDTGGGSYSNLATYLGQLNSCGGPWTLTKTSGGIGWGTTLTMEVV